MTNFEMYENDLMKIKGCFAIDKAQRRIVRCDARIVLSNNELELIKSLSKVTGKEYKYITRDAYNVIRLFETKPSTDKSGNYWGEYTYVDIGDGVAGRILFSNITHKDGLYDIKNKCFIKEGDD